MICQKICQIECQIECQKICDRMPDRMPEGMSDRMPEDMPDRMSEDLPVTKRINVMVGITRSKVIVFVYSSTVCGWLLAKVQHGALQS